MKDFNDHCLKTVYNVYVYSFLEYGSIFGRPFIINIIRLCAYKMAIRSEEF